MRGRLKLLTAASCLAVLGFPLVMPVVAEARVTDCVQYAKDSADREAHPTGTGRRIVVVGDSYSLGTGLRDTTRGWTSQIPGHVQVFGFGGSGFVSSTSPCGPQVAFAERAPAALATHPSLVIVEGGLNDIGQPDAAIVKGFRAVMAEIGALPTLVIGPAPATPRAEGAAHVDQLLHAEATRAGKPYLSMIGQHFTYGPPRHLHLDLASHTAYAAIVTAELKVLRKPASTPTASPSTEPVAVAPAIGPARPLTQPAKSHHGLLDFSRWETWAAIVALAMLVLVGLDRLRDRTTRPAGAGARRKK